MLGASIIIQVFVYYSYCYVHGYSSHLLSHFHKIQSIIALKISLKFTPKLIKIHLKIYRFDKIFKTWVKPHRAQVKYKFKRIKTPTHWKLFRNRLIRKSSKYSIQIEKCMSYFIAVCGILTFYSGFVHHFEDHTPLKFNFPVDFLAKHLPNWNAKIVAINNFAQG